MRKKAWQKLDLASNKKKCSPSAEIMLAIKARTRRVKRIMVKYTRENGNRRCSLCFFCRQCALVIAAETKRKFGWLLLWWVLKGSSESSLCWFVIFVDFRNARNFLCEVRRSTWCSYQKVQKNESNESENIGAKPNPTIRQNAPVFWTTQNQIDDDIPAA